MSDHHIPGDLTGKATQAVPPLADELARRLGVDLQEDAVRETISYALIEAFSEGARAGAAEVTAQAVERGIDLRIVPPDEPTDG